MRMIAALCLTVSVGAAFNAPSVKAQGLQIQPLIYKEKFSTGEVKKGFVQVANPTASTVTVTAEVQGFKQVDSRGTLTFFDSPDLNKAIIPDLAEFELKPREKIRLFFIIDSKKMPTGDNFAALFFRNKVTGTAGINTSVRVGTLFVIENGTPGPRQADITKLQLPWVVFGNSVSGTVNVKNTADPNKATGFFPKMTVGISPFTHSHSQDGSLLFAGISRDMTFHIPTSRLGVYKVSVAVAGDTESRWVFMATGWGLLGFITLVALAISIIFTLMKLRRARSKIRLTN